MKLNVKSNNNGSTTSEVLFNQTFSNSNGNNSNGGSSSNSFNSNNYGYNNNNNNNNSGSNSNNEFQFASNRGVHAIHSSSTTLYQPTIKSPISSSSSHSQSSHDRSSRVGDATTNSVYERSIIENLCVPGGLRPVPPENELQDFLNVAPTLSADIVGRLVGW